MRVIEARPTVWQARRLVSEHRLAARGNDIESRPDDQPYLSRLVLGTCGLGSLHVAVRDNIDDEMVVETAYMPDPAIWEPDFKERRKKSR